MDVLLIIACFVGIVLWKIKKPFIKGKIGEMSVAALLSFLPKSKYVVLNDLMFKIGGNTTQIDHIVVSIYGIFVIETKNYKGWIFGNENGDYWTQNIWGKKYALYNPLYQNKRHISFLLRKFNMLEERCMYIFPVVVFLRASKLRLTGDCDCVLKLYELISYIHSFKHEIMTIDDCNYIASIFQENNVEDRSVRKTHKHNVKFAKRRHENKVMSGICPRCGGDLIKKAGRYGDFYGCSNYPLCKYSHK